MLPRLTPRYAIVARQASIPRGWKQYPAVFAEIVKLARMAARWQQHRARTVQAESILVKELHRMTTFAKIAREEAQAPPGAFQTVIVPKLVLLERQALTAKLVLIAMSISSKMFPVTQHAKPAQAILVQMHRVPIARTARATSAIQVQMGGRATLVKQVS